MNIKSEVEKMKHHGRSKWVRLLIVPTLALALGGSVAAYKFATPAAANAAMAAPPAAPLDADSVAPLIALNRAMETLAARVTPAVVNVTVTSRTKPDATQGQMPEGMEQFFGQFFGPNGGPNGGPRMQPQSQIEHGMGSGVVGMLAAPAWAESKAQEIARDFAKGEFPVDAGTRIITPVKAPASLAW